MSRDDASFMICKSAIKTTKLDTYFENKNHDTLIMPYRWNHIYSITDDNKTLAPRYDIGWQFFDTMVRDHIVQYNYTLNPEGIFGAIKYMYTYYPDPNNRSHIREEFINVSMNWDLFSWFVVEVWIWWNISRDYYNHLWFIF